jgi:hypothetical protein
MVLEKLFVGMMCLLLSFFPGILLFRKCATLPLLIRISTAISLSVSFWVLMVWIAFTAHIPLQGMLWVVLGMFIAMTAMGLFRNPIEWKRPSFNIAHLIFGLGILLILFPFVMMTIPPGCDITMHGYITRLIINNNGVPLTYDPFLPDSPFGGYSAGYQALTALIAGVLPIFLQEAINSISVLVYVLLLVNMGAFYRLFVTGKHAMLAAVFTFFIAGSLKTTIGWGGNPTILAMALCICFFTLLINGMKERNTTVLWFAAVPVAAVPMVHAIPAVACIYISIPVVAYLVFANLNDWKWLFKNLFMMGGIAGLLVLPFALNFHNDSSAELTRMIRDWQDTMMNDTLTDSLGHNLLACLTQIIYRAGDPMAIIFAFCLVVMMINGVRKAVTLLLLMIAYLYLLIVNCGYWVLPLSEILYPERVMYFIIILMGIPLAYFLPFLSAWSLTTSPKRWIQYALFIGFFGMGIASFWNEFVLRILRDNKIVCDAPAMAAFSWAETSTPTNAQFTCTYADMGMWIPAFSNRATIGTHIHFIHEITQRFKVMEQLDVPRYYWVTVDDIKDQTPMIAKVKGKKLVYHNSRVYIYQ